MGVLQASPDRPSVIVPVVAHTAAAILDAAAAIPANGVDLVEWRADYYTELADVEQTVALLQYIRQSVNVPLIFTMRSTTEGGHANLSGATYADIIWRCAKEALSTGDYVDIELRHLGAPTAIEMCRSLPDPVGVIVSHHNFTDTPDSQDMYSLLEACLEFGADVVKLAVTPHSFADVARLLDTVDRFTRTHDVPTIGIAMGDLGTTSRTTGHLFGSCATFATVAESSAPGQIPLERLLDALGGSR